MITEETALAMCGRKQRFATAQGVWDFLERLKKRNRRRGGAARRRAEVQKLTPYRCPVCHGWHYGFDGRKHGARP